MPSSSAEPPIEEFRTRAAWEKWLERRHGDDAGVWIKFAKKGTGVTTVTYAEALEVALCYGWIDGQVKRFDESTSCSGSRRGGRAASGRRSTVTRRRV